MCNEYISTPFLPLYDCLLCPRAPFLWEDVEQEVELAGIPCGVQAAISCANPCHAVPANGSAQTTVRKKSTTSSGKYELGLPLPLLWSQKNSHVHKESGCVQ